MKLACLGMILTACCRAQSPFPVEKATVSGMVTNAAGEALRRATVRLVPLPAGRGSSMDARGSNSTMENNLEGNFIPRKSHRTGTWRSQSEQGT
jgi:hypothetical protein